MKYYASLLFSSSDTNIWTFFFTLVLFISLFYCFLTSTFNLIHNLFFFPFFLSVISHAHSLFPASVSCGQHRIFKNAVSPTWSGMLTHQTAQMSSRGDAGGLPSPHISLYSVASERHLFQNTSLLVFLSSQCNRSSTKPIFLVPQRRMVTEC